MTFNEVIEKTNTLEHEDQKDIVYLPKHQSLEEIEEEQNEEEEPLDVEMHQPIVMQQPEVTKSNQEN